MTLINGGVRPFPTLDVARLLVQVRVDGRVEDGLLDVAHRVEGREEAEEGQAQDEHVEILGRRLPGHLDAVAISHRAKFLLHSYTFCCVNHKLCILHELPTVALSPSVPLLSKKEQTSPNHVLQAMNGRHSMYPEHNILFKMTKCALAKEAT